MTVRRRVFAFALMTGVLLALTSAAGAADPIACGAVITENVTLSHDLVDCESGLSIEGTNVSLDLNGHRIVGQGVGEGVRVSGADVVIRNGTITGFATGVLLDAGSARVHAANLEIASNGTGVLGSDPDASADFAIDHSAVHHNGTGLLLFDADRAEIVDNRIAKNGQHGLFTVLADGSRIEGNTFQGNGGDGAHLIESTALILGNTFSDNGGDGLDVDDICFPGLAFYRVGSNLATKNNGLGINLHFGACPPQVPPDLLDALDAGGNAASRNGDVRQCTMVVCSRNRGQANKLEPLPEDGIPQRSDSSS